MCTPAAWSPDGKWISFRFSNERYWSNRERMLKVYAEKPADKRPVWVIRPDVPVITDLDVSPVPANQIQPLTVTGPIGVVGAPWFVAIAHSDQSQTVHRLPGTMRGAQRQRDPSSPIIASRLPVITDLDVSPVPANQIQPLTVTGPIL
jgi:hypothetical protein